MIAGQEIELLQNEVDDLAADPDAEKLNSVVEKLTSKLYTAANTCEKKSHETVTPDLPEITGPMEFANEVLLKHTVGRCTWEEWNGARKDAVNSISVKMLKEKAKEWSNTLMCNDSKKIWELIDWKGYCKGD